MEFLKYCSILYIIVIKYTKACTMSYDESTDTKDCILSCNGYIDESTYNLVYKRYGYGTVQCTKRTNAYGERILYIAELKYKIKTFTDSIPQTGYYGQNVIDAVNSLNLRDNDLNNTPTIKSMAKLKSIDMSNNNIVTAILSNSNELKMLTEIDYSHNKITDIQVDNLQFVYHKLTAIYMSHNALVNIPDAIFYDFRDLQVLDLSFNYIESLSAVTFEGVRKLTELDLSNNRIKNINASLFRFTELNFLNVSSNQIESLSSNDFKQLSALEKLDLSSNVIKVITVNIFENTNMLKTLNLMDNLLQIIEPKAFSSLRSLNYINLSKNDLKLLQPDLFKNASISRFSIDTNKLEGALKKGMFEGIHVTKLDLSYQFLTQITDYAFYNLDILNELFLNSNDIGLLSKYSLKYLVNLKQLDLSNNIITNIDFDKEDLTNLLSLRLKNNHINQIKPDELESLRSLQFLDISENRITQLTPDLFQSLSNLVNLEISSNPLQGSIESGTFEGLVLLPSIDVSYSFFTAIKNSSFTDMRNLKDVNVTHCAVSELQYNVFINTGSIETLDLSHNQLTVFFINTTELGALSKLFLNNNLIKTIVSSSLRGIPRLTEINLSHNLVENMPTEINFTKLHYLDFSYNEHFNFNVSILKGSKALHCLMLSGIRSGINFRNITRDNSITDLFLANATITSISHLNLSNMVNLASLELSSNNISQLLVGDFNSLSSLEKLDLSFNNISYIQPGVFKDNGFINILNISHNCISSISYGIFRGLNSLQILDISFNKIKDLQGQRFYEVKHLTQLIVDFNLIESINPEEFSGTSLSKLSIGSNPIHCKDLVKLSTMDLQFAITSIEFDEHSNENVNGVICNNVRRLLPNLKTTNTEDFHSILETLNNILENLNTKITKEEGRERPYLEKISKSLDNLSQVLIINNNTYIMLKKLLKSQATTTVAPVITTSSVGTTTATSKMAHTPAKKYVSNVTSEVDIISYINQIKNELQNTISSEKQSVIDTMERKCRSDRNNRSELLPASIDVAKLSSNNSVPTSLFVETYIALVLSVLLVCVLAGLLLYRFYQSRLRGNFSISNHVLPGAIDNSSL